MTPSVALASAICQWRQRTDLSSSAFRRPLVNDDSNMRGGGLFLERGRSSGIQSRTRTALEYDGATDAAEKL